MPNGDEIGIVRPLRHSQRGPTRVLPAFGAEFVFWAPDEAPSLFIGQKCLKKGRRPWGFKIESALQPPTVGRFFFLIGPISPFLSQSKTGPFGSFWVLWVLVHKDPPQAPTLRPNSRFIYPGPTKLLFLGLVSKACGCVSFVNHSHPGAVTHQKRANLGLKAGPQGISP